jgi:PPE-repeat protein
MVVDFAVLPPEINPAWMYTGSVTATLHDRKPLLNKAFRDPRRRVRAAPVW